MLNPFDTSTHKSNLVMNLATGMTSSEEVSKDIMSAKEKGNTCLNEFVNTRLVEGHEKGVLEPIRKNKLKTLSFFRTPVKVPSDKGSVNKSLDADRGFFSRLIVVAKSRSVDLKDVLAHELAPVPYSLAYPDSTLRKPQKSTLLHLLESEADSCDSPPNSNSRCSWIYDGMALVQKNKATNQTNFGEYADFLLKIILRTFHIENCTRVDVVFDRYDKELSIKTQERLRRQTSAGLCINIHGPNTQIPKQWSKFMDAPKSKANLAAFLCEYWSVHGSSRLPDAKSLYLGGGFEDGLIAKRVTANGIEVIHDMFTDQEEADTRMLLHAMEQFPRIIIDSPDTDVAVLCIYFFERLSKVSELYFHTGTSDKQRFIQIHDIARALGSTLSMLLLPFHALTGCDSTSSICKLGKIKPWKILRDQPEEFESLSSLGSSPSVYCNTLNCVEKFFCKAFRSKRTSIDETRYAMFCRKSTKTEALPPTKNSLIHHVNRANYQTLIWKSALDPNANVGSPIGNGWKKDGTLILPVLMTA